jgi:hypothetical protein
MEMSMKGRFRTILVMAMDCLGTRRALRSIQVEISPYLGYWQKDNLSGSGMLKNKKSNGLTLVDYKKITVNDTNWL